MPIRAKVEVGRNEPCPCKSGLRYKHCHGDVAKQILCKQAANEKMVELIGIEVRKKTKGRYKQAVSKLKRKGKHERN